MGRGLIQIISIKGSHSPPARSESYTGNEARSLRQEKRPTTTKRRRGGGGHQKKNKETNKGKK